jgi:hypothetical protein
VATGIDTTIEDSFFSPGGAGRAYEVCRDDWMWRSETKALVEGLWGRFRRYCGDKNFRSDARGHFHQRTWEMYLASVLLDAGISLAPAPPKGPDLVLEIGGNRAWVEAIAVEKGDGADAVSLPEARGYTRKRSDGFSTWRGQPPTEEELILRLTHAISTKYKKRADYVAEGIVGADEPFVIAINAGALPDVDFHFGLRAPLIVKALFEVGDEFIAVPMYSSADPTVGHHHRPEIKKEKGELIRCDGFTSDTYPGLSGVLYSETTISNVPAQHGRELYFVHNPRATAKLPQGTFPFGREWLVKDDELVWKKHFRAAATDDE